MNTNDFDWKKHGEYFKKHMRTLHPLYVSMDTNRLTLLYFCVSGLDLLGMLDDVDKTGVVRYIYSLQSQNPHHGGFYGYPRVAFGSEEEDSENNQPHIANTYVALVMLLILGDDLEGVRRESIRASMRKWQLPDGSFCCVHGISSLDSESDMRFVYCAAAICHVLDLWDSVDVTAMISFIRASRSFDGAFGMRPQNESHGGCTYCALASLHMLGQLPLLPAREQLVGWCAKRQQLGFQGRIEKAIDSCYSFWVGGSLQLLGAESLLERASCSSFLRQCESPSGGFQKYPESQVPDLLHSYFSVCGLSLCGLLRPLDAVLNMSAAARAHARAGAFSSPTPACDPKAALLMLQPPDARPPPQQPSPQAALAREQRWPPLAAALVLAGALLAGALVGTWR